MLQSKQAEGGRERERVTEQTGKGWKGQSCRVNRQRVEESYRVNRQRVEERERELQSKQAEDGTERVAE